MKGFVGILLVALLFAPAARAASGGTVAGEVGLGLVSMAVGGVGAGYLMYEATGGPGEGDNIGYAATALFVVAPTVIAGAVYGTATGVAAAGPGFSSMRPFWNASKGAWAGVLTAGLINLSYSAVQRSSESGAIVAYVSLLALPIFSATVMNWSVKPSARVEKDEAGARILKPMIVVATEV